MLLFAQHNITAFEHVEKKKNLRYRLPNLNSEIKIVGSFANQVFQFWDNDTDIEMRTNINESLFE
jgi:hypothetical protein